MNWPWQAWHLTGRAVRPLKTTIFWLLSRTHRSTRPRVAIVTERQILLVKNWGDHDWALPGGGQHRTESSQAAAQREVSEELGVRIPAAELRYVTTVRLNYYDAPLYCWKISQHRADKLTIRRQKWEIFAVEWYQLDDLPAVSRGTERLLAAVTSVENASETGKNLAF